MLSIASQTMYPRLKVAIMALTKTGSLIGIFDQRQALSVARSAYAACYDIAVLLFSRKGIETRGQLLSIQPAFRSDVHFQSPDVIEQVTVGDCRGSEAAARYVRHLAVEFEAER